MQAGVRKLVAHRYFERFIIGLILFNSVVLGVETVPEWVEAYGEALHWVNGLILWVFVVEVLLKWIAVAPRLQDYFRDGWNVFDFTIVVLSLLPATGQFAMIARLGRLLRVLRLISAMPQLRLIVQTLMRSIPGMGNIVLLMGIIFYVYAIVGYQLFHAHDPEHWRSLGVSLLTLFRVVTLEDWTDVMYTGMELSPYAWIYFVSFVVVGTFVVINLFIAVVLNNMDKLHQEEQQQHNEHEPTLAQLQTELRELRELMLAQQERGKNKDKVIA